MHKRSLLHVTIHLNQRKAVYNKILVISISDRKNNFPNSLSMTELTRDDMEAFACH